MEKDFEGGQWIGGEFYFGKRIEKRARTRDAVIYGVFASNSSSDDDCHPSSKRTRGRDTGRKPDFTKTVSSVATGKVVFDY